jgi:hypothetical protein
MTVTGSRGAAAHGIATTYAGSRFRSRLEAKWAAFFDLVGWRWTYEPFDTDAYIPDFLVHGPASFLVEVGPCEFLSEFSEKATKPLAAFGRERTVLILGIDPLILDDRSETLPRAGYLTNDGEDGWEDTAPARWAVCHECGRLGIWHEVGYYRLHPCGHADGNNHLRAVPALQLRGLWAEAGSKTQWRSR